MEFIHDKQEKRGRFHSADGKAEIVYSWFREDAIIIEHTEVDQSLEGQGVGKKLVNAVAGFARETGIKIRPSCVFAKAVMERGESYKDVLY
ncbi:MAG: N-acetyltransferase, partial [Sphingobacteriales bacterium]